MQSTGQRPALLLPSELELGLKWGWEPECRTTLQEEGVCGLCHSLQTRASPVHSHCLPRGYTRGLLVSIQGLGT